MTSSSSTRFQNHHRLLFFSHMSRHYRIKLVRSPSSTTFEAAKNTKCLNTTSTTTSTLLIPAFLFTMCRIATPRSGKSPKFWPGYLHSNPKDGITTFEPVGSLRWGNGSYKRRNIGIGLVVFVGVYLITQLCFAMEVRGLARPTLGKREETREKNGIANKL